MINRRYLSYFFFCSASVGSFMSSVRNLSSSRTRDDSGGPFGGLIRLPPISVVAHLGRVVRGPSYISLNTFPSRIQTSPALPDWVMDMHSMVLTSSKVYEACYAVIRLYHLMQSTSPSFGYMPLSFCLILPSLRALVVL